MTSGVTKVKTCKFYELRIGGRAVLPYCNGTDLSFCLVGCDCDGKGGLCTNGCYAEEKEPIEIKMVKGVKKEMNLVYRIAKKALEDNREELAQKLADRFLNDGIEDDIADNIDYDIDDLAETLAECSDYRDDVVQKVTEAIQGEVSDLISTECVDDELIEKIAEIIVKG